MGLHLLVKNGPGPLLKSIVKTGSGTPMMEGDGDTALHTSNLEILFDKRQFKMLMYFERNMTYSYIIHVFMYYVYCNLYYVTPFHQHTFLNKSFEMFRLSSNKNLLEFQVLLT